MVDQLSTNALAWLEGRGLDPELAIRLGLESRRAKGGGEVLVWPYMIGDQAVNHKYRRLPKEGFWQDKDAVKCFWNYPALTDPTLSDLPLIITEGEPDAMVALQLLYPRTVSVPDGAPAVALTDGTTQKYEYIDHAMPLLRGAREIILAVDGDDAGSNLLTDLSIRLGRAKCKWLKYPPGCKDLNDVLLKLGESAVHKLIREAQWCKVDGLYRMSDLPPMPERKRYYTGFDFFDKHYRVRMGDFVVLTARPGDGKTSLITDLTCRMAEQYGWTIAVASFEQQAQTDYRRALRMWYCRSPLDDGADQPTELVSPAEIASADAWIDQHFVFIVPSDDDAVTLDWVLDKAATAKLRYGASVFVADPWNEMDHARNRDETMHEYTGRAIKEFKRLARRLEMHTIVAAHPTKLEAKERPSLYSISDSAHWANKCDIGIVMYRIDANVVEIRFAKSKYHDQIGKPGCVYATFSELTRRYAQTQAPARPAKTEASVAKEA